MVKFSERLKAAMELPRENGGETTLKMLALACGCTYQAAKKWTATDDAKLSAANNCAAAAYLGVRSDWLATGEGPMLAGEAGQSPFRAKVTLERALNRMGDSLLKAGEDQRKKAMPLLHALIANPEQAAQLAPMVVALLDQLEAQQTASSRP